MMGSKKYWYEQSKGAKEIELHWIDDSENSRFSRYVLSGGAEDSDDIDLWVCNECDAPHADPYLKGCSKCGQAADD